jgi:prefoldin subunit 4
MAGRINTEVLFEDQQKINRLSLLNMEWHDYERELKQEEEKVSAYQDALDELELLGEPTVRILVGESFVESTEEDAIQRVEKLLGEKRQSVATIQEKMSEMEHEMKSLKSYLYARFGSNINLEED